MKKFEKPEMEVIVFEVEDVIVTSGDNGESTPTPTPTGRDGGGDPTSTREPGWSDPTTTRPPDSI